MSRVGENANHYKHGGAPAGHPTPEYRAWQGAKRRCFNQSRPDYKNYGGRGITMCDRWREDFGAFLADMGPRPPKAQLDRINNEGNYEPGNCRWADKLTQMNNTRLNRQLTLNGRTMNLSEWARAAGLSDKLLWARLDGGWELSRALGQSVKAHVPLSAASVDYIEQALRFGAESQRVLARRLGVSRGVIRWVADKMARKDALGLPVAAPAPDCYQISFEVR